MKALTELQNQISLGHNLIGIHYICSRHDENMFLIYFTIRGHISSQPICKSIDLAVQYSLVVTAGIFYFLE